MTKRIQRTNQFKKDIKRLKKQGKQFNCLKQVIEKLTNNIKLENRYQDHKLRGKYINCRECHLEPDWLLIYENASTEVILRRTGSHSELFNNV